MLAKLFPSPAGFRVLEDDGIPVVVMRMNPQSPPGVIMPLLLPVGVIAGLGLWALIIATLGPRDLSGAIAFPSVVVPGLLTGFWMTSWAGGLLGHRRVAFHEAHVSILGHDIPYGAVNGFELLPLGYVAADGMGGATLLQEGPFGPGADVQHAANVAISYQRRVRMPGQAVRDDAEETMVRTLGSLPQPAAGELCSKLNELLYEKAPGERVDMSLEAMAARAIAKRDAALRDGDRAS